MCPSDPKVRVLPRLDPPFGSVRTRPTLPPLTSDALNTLRWFGNVLASSVGRKVVMALTGLLLVGFLVAHLAGNLTLFADSDGAAFNDYAQKLQDLGPILLVMELGLVALFGIHVFLAIRLTLENRDARTAKYAVRSGRGAKTMASASMPVTGVIVLAFLIKHLIDFRFDGAFHEDGAATVAAKMADPLNAVLYLVAFGVLGLHLSHGVQSALQSLGANHPRYTPLVKNISIGLGVILALGFAAIPLYYLFLGGANG